MKEIVLVFKKKTEKKNTLSLFMVTLAKRKKCFTNNNNLVDSNYH